MNNMKSFENYYNQSLDSYKNKDYDKALEYIQKAITIDHKNLDAWYIITKIYLSLNRIEEASSCAITLINLDNNNPKAWHLRARVLIGLMRYDEALIASNKSMQLDSSNLEYKKINKNIKEFVDLRRNNKSHKEHLSQESYEQDVSYEEENFNPMNKYESIFKVTRSKNISLFKQKKLNSKIYYRMLDNLMDNILIRANKISDDSIYNKITQFVSFFAEIQYESIDNAEGLYLFNTIKLDKKNKDIENIAILIHELAHHLLSEIFEISLMYLFDSEKTDAIEAFSWYTLNFKDEYILLNEYCAHTVENYFIPFQYKNFESFNRLLNKFDLDNKEDMEKINHATKLGNTFAQDIIYMLNKYLDNRLKKEIRKQFIIDGYVFYLFNDAKFKTNELFNDDEKFNKINLMFSESIINIKSNFAIFDLINYKNIFRKVNNRIN